MGEFGIGQGKLGLRWDFPFSLVHTTGAAELGYTGFENSPFSKQFNAANPSESAYLLQPGIQFQGRFYQHSPVTVHTQIKGAYLNGGRLNGGEALAGVGARYAVIPQLSLGLDASLGYRAMSGKVFDQDAESSQWMLKPELLAEIKASKHISFGAGIGYTVSLDATQSTPINATPTDFWSASVFVNWMFETSPAAKEKTIASDASPVALPAPASPSAK